MPESDQSSAVFFLRLLSLSFLKDYFFREVLGLRQNWESSTKLSRITPAPTPAWLSPLSNISPIINICCNRWTYSTHHNYPESTVYTRLHWWCSPVYGFGRMDNNVYPSLWHHTECFHCRKNPCPWVFFISSSIHICHRALNVRALVKYTMN